MATTPPAPGGRGAGGRSWRAPAVVGVAVAAVLLLAVLADGRLLVADPDASAVTAADVRLARALARSGVDAQDLAPACFDDAGDVDLRCLGDGEISPDAIAELVPRSCRNASGVSASCIEDELGVDVPERCRSRGEVDVACVAGEGTVLVLTDECVTDGGFRLRSDCVTAGVYGVPEPDDETTSRPTASTTRPELDDTPASTLPERSREREPPREDTGLRAILGVLASGLAVLLLVAAVIAGVILGICVLAGWRPRWAAPPVAPDATVTAHDRAVMAASVEASALQLDLSGDPRQAIIAAYAMLLEGLSACAQGREPAETPLEHLERVLAALDVHPDPLRELTGLFGEARFSDHAMTDAQRDRARAALAAAATDLDRVRETVG